MRGLVLCEELVKAEINAYHRDEHIEPVYYHHIIIGGLTTHR